MKITMTPICQTFSGMTSRGAAAFKGSRRGVVSEALRSLRPAFPALSDFVEPVPTNFSNLLKPVQEYLIDRGNYSLLRPHDKIIDTVVSQQLLSVEPS